MSRRIICVLLLFACGLVVALVDYPSPERVRASAATSAAVRLLRIGDAIRQYHAATGDLPSSMAHDSKGRGGLSWRVAILPYLDEEDLYREFHLDEPWDSQHNRTLIGRMPSIYAPPEDLATPEGTGRTCCAAVLGPGTIMGQYAGRPLGPSVLTDSAAALVVQIDPAHAVLWTKPEDLIIVPGRALSPLDERRQSNFMMLRGDGTVRLVRGPVGGEDALRAMLLGKGPKAPADQVKRLQRPTKTLHIPRRGESCHVGIPICGLSAYRQP